VDCDHNTDTINTDSYGKDHSIKCTCIILPEKYATNKGNLVTSKSLAFHIEERPLWEENNNTFSLSSQTHKIENQNENILDTIDSMSADNTLFADNNIRYTTLPYKHDYSTNLLSVLKPWITALNYRMKIYCSVTYVLKNACI